MRGDVTHDTNLQYKVKALTAQVKAFESGQQYQKQETFHRKELAQRDRTIKALRQERDAAYGQVTTMRQNWMQVFDDMESDFEKERKQYEAEKKRLLARAYCAEAKAEEHKEQWRAQTEALYQVKAQLEDSQERIRKLKGQINRDYETSSLPSSAKPNRKKIQNNREKIGRRPGGQPGHKGHGRKWLAPTKVHEIPAPKKYVEHPDYIPTGKTISKQLINLQVKLSVDAYQTPQFRHRKTGVRVHAPFPKGLVNEVNYGGSVKAFAFLLNNHCNVSIDKVRDLLFEVTGGELAISKGMVNGLSHAFSEKTQAQREDLFHKLLLTEAMHTDCTNARACGKNAYVYVCATPKETMYFAREHKGHRGVEGTPLVDYQGIMIHDHEMTFYRYGTGHQECLSHVLRYLKDSVVNEPDRTWHKQMRDLIREMIHYRKSLPPGEMPSAKAVKVLEDRYNAILSVAKEEYAYEPPSKYYREGYNLYRRLETYMEHHLLFLHHAGLPSDNNLSERLLRVFKRKQKQVMTLRSFDSLVHLCDSMSVLASLRT